MFHPILFNLLKFLRTPSDFARDPKYFSVKNDVYNFIVPKVGVPPILNFYCKLLCDVIDFFFIYFNFEKMPEWYFWRFGMFLHANIDLFEVI